MFPRLVLKPGLWLVLVVYTHKPSLGAGHREGRVQGHSWLQGDFEAGLGYVRPCLPQHKKGGDIAWLVECLLSPYKALGFFNSQ